MLSNSRSGSEILNWFSLIDNVLLFDYVVDFLGGRGERERGMDDVHDARVFSFAPKAICLCANTLSLRYRDEEDDRVNIRR